VPSRCTFRCRYDDRKSAIPTTAVPGCRKRRTEDCSAKFNNVVNIARLPDVPLNDKVIGNATAADAPQS
jgi:hypothetical protein